MSEPNPPPGYSRYEILKIWIPTHGVVNIYRKPGRVPVYHADNGVILEEPIIRYGVEKLRLLASQGGVIKITRDESVPALQNKYTIEPPLSMDQSQVLVKDARY